MTAYPFLAFKNVQATNPIQ